MEKATRSKMKLILNPNLPICSGFCFNDEKSEEKLLYILHDINNLIIYIKG